MDSNVIGAAVSLQQSVTQRDLGIVGLKAQKQAAQGIVAIVEQAADAAAGKQPGKLDLSV
jgi:hypothetical protein